MKIFRDLYIHLNGVDVNTFSELLENTSKKPWVRRKDKEEELGSNKERSVCFEAIENSSVSAAALFIFPYKDETLWVSNIVPTEVSELTYDQYNSTLENFYRNVILPAIDGTAITADLTSDQISIGSVAGNEAEKAFIQFSSSANKSTGSSHPSDRKRWLEFLVLVHKAKSDLDTDVVIRALVEQGWSEEKAIELGIQFEFAEDLLSYIQGR
ncbi:hypothetical protein [Idiomarina sp. HP20-50]|uniref:hypothetical protein n=1 Tax=Idiomarina sp. HP20-50 TaxID=3070813 RepID=UPI00294B6A7A|nr:hypothetical protein [Idiomarina sp. HP20-50]MDV6315927.1 hypothetical protein [Idiomarina sp. HP20-50]